MNQIQVDLNKTLNAFEKGLNLVGYVPGVSSISGVVRVGYGKLEIIGAIASASLIAIKALLNTSSTLRNHELNKAFKVIVEYSSHGGANMIRGIIETIPFASLVTCLPYDLLGYRYSYPVRFDEQIIHLLRS